MIRMMIDIWPSWEKRRVRKDICIKNAMMNFREIHHGTQILLIGLPRFIGIQDQQTMADKDSEVGCLVGEDGVETGCFLLHYFPSTGPMPTEDS